VSKEDGQSWAALFKNSPIYLSLSLSLSLSSFVLLILLLLLLLLGTIVVVFDWRTPSVRAMSLALLLHPANERATD
jgi:hypothetical protein